jgi:hypothetical protein
MNNNTRDVIGTLKGINSLQDINNLRTLDLVAQQMYESGTPPEGIDAFLSLYERFPIEDGLVFFGQFCMDLKSFLTMRIIWFNLCCVNL